MSSPSNFILNSDYATLKNSQYGLTAQVTVPGSSTLYANSYLEWHTDITITEPFAMSACRIASSKNSNKYLVGNNTYMNRSADYGGFYDIPYGINVFVFRTNSTTVRFQALINNPYNFDWVLAPTDETFSLYMYTFVPPFS